MSIIKKILGFVFFTIFIIIIAIFTYLNYINEKDITDSKKDIDFTEMASKNKDIALCEKVRQLIPFGTSPREICFKRVIEENNDASICENAVFQKPGNISRDECLRGIKEFNK
jgi:hypothetical protein